MARTGQIARIVVGEREVTARAELAVELARQVSSGDGRVRAPPIGGEVPPGLARRRPGRSPSQVAWIWAIIPALVNIWLLSIRPTWSR
jgi:hypothetical protein